jgi:hypothetical protein
MRQMRARVKKIRHKKSLKYQNAHQTACQSANQNNKWQKNENLRQMHKNDEKRQIEKLPVLLRGVFRY